VVYARAVRWLLGVACCYGVLWALTVFIGAPQVENDMLTQMAARSRERVNHYHATARSPAPLIVIVDYGDSSGPLAAYGRTEWRIWILGVHARLTRTAAWVV
jgi:hypothetical protein